MNNPLKFILIIISLVITSCTNEERKEHKVEINKSLTSHVQFISNAFPKASDENVINEHIWGKNLAFYIKEHLAEYGIIADDIYPEDWGWAIEIHNKKYPAFIGCSNQLEPNGNLFLCFVNPGSEMNEQTLYIVNVLNNIFINDKNISEIKWWTEKQIKK